GHMGAPEPRPLFPSLMDLPNLPADRRDAIHRQAQDQMKSGEDLLSKALEQLSRAATADDQAALQEATERAREGLERFESGLAAHRALAEGQPPRRIALRWFKRQTDLPTPAEATAHVGPFGLSWFHFFVMAILIAFAAGTVGLYFYRMQRAALLLRGLMGRNPPAPGAGAGDGAAASQP